MITKMSKRRKKKRKRKRKRTVRVRRSSSGRLSPLLSRGSICLKILPAVPAAVTGRNMKFLSMSQTKDFSLPYWQMKAPIYSNREKTKRKRLPKNVGDDDRTREN